MKQSQLGFSALEVMICLIIGTLATVAAIPMYQNYNEKQLRLVAAQQMEYVSDAAAKYIKDNYASVVSVATSTSPATISVTMLRNTGYLPASFSDQNTYGQTYTVRALEPTPNKLETLVVTQSGETIAEMSLLEISRLIGARGGYISKSSSSMATGTMGGWQVSLASYGVSPGAGHLATALFFDDGSVVNDYLYRNAVPGQPEVNRMNTSIDVNSNDLQNIKNTNTENLNANTAKITGNTDTQGETYTGGWFRSKGDGGWYSEKYGGGWYMTEPTWLRVWGDKNILTGGQIRGGTLFSQGRTDVGSYLYLQAESQANWPCEMPGLMSRNAAGEPLSCQGGVWKLSKGIGLSQQISGVCQPEYVSTKTCHLADASWFCTLSGVSGAGEEEDGNVYLSGGQWYIYTQRGAWPAKYRWTCFK